MNGKDSFNIKIFSYEDWLIVSDEDVKEKKDNAIIFKTKILI